MNINNKIVREQYKTLDVIGEGGISIVYKAHDLKNNRDVALKILKQQNTSNRIEDIIRFRSEGYTVTNLSHPNIIKLFDIGEWNGFHYIAMEYIDGRSLQNILNNNINLNFKNIIVIISEICKALDFIHHNNIIHRDLKPGNILIPDIDGIPDFKKLKIIDFGLSQIKDFTGLHEPDEIAGTFSYMPPEQIGVIKRITDERSDLYSLGIILYQLLTKQLPFRGDSVSSIIHQHIAKRPVPPSQFNKDIPEIIEMIILKLLEKEPDSRYQSAKGLLADIEKFREDRREKFTLGQNDSSIKLDYRTSLVGREREIGTLIKLYEKTKTSKGSVCLVSGEAGQGKSRLIEELRDYVYTEDGLFINGKCFSGENKVPYFAFKEALNIYIKVFSRYSSEKQENLRSKIKNSLGDLVEIIFILSPLMKEVIGKELIIEGKENDLSLPDAERETKRFLMVASRFFQELGVIDKNIVIFLDDLQWADDGTINLLHEMVRDISDFPVLLIGAYRDDEIGEEHSLRKFIIDARANNYPFEELSIDLFDRSKMKKFISGLLHDSEENIENIADFILKKSEGNPFFAIEILKQLVNSGAVSQEENQLFTDNKWTIIPEKLNAIEISSSILDILIKRINLLDEKEIKLLSYASVIGSKFDIELLFHLCRNNSNLSLSEKEVVEDVDHAIALQLLEEDIQEKGRILFVHDRIKEAFYANIDHEERKILHKQIAETMEKIYSENIESRIFELAYHYIETGIGGKILTYAYPAGISAMENYANEEAIKYFNITIEILEKQTTIGSFPWIDCKGRIGDIFITMGRNDEAIEIFSDILNYQTNDIKKAEVYSKICKAYFQKADYDKGEEYGRYGVKLLGESLPKKRYQIILGILKELLIHFVYSMLPLSSKKKKKQSISLRFELIISLYVTLNWVYILTDVLKFIKLSIRMLNISRNKLGKSKELGMSLAGYASVLMAIPLKRSLKLHKRSLNLRYEFNDKWGMGQSLQFLGFNHQWRGEYFKSIEYFNQCLDIFKNIYDVREYEITLQAIFNHYYYISEYNKARSVLEEYYEFSRFSTNYFGICLYLINSMQVDIEIGNYLTALENGRKCYELTRTKELWYLFCCSCIEIARVYINNGNAEEAIKYLEEAKLLYEKNNYLKHYTVQLYCYLAEAYLADFLSKAQYLAKNQDIEDEIMANKQILKRNRTFLNKIKFFCDKALKETKSWPTHYGRALKINAQYYSIIDKKRKAEKLFIQSIEHLSAIGRKYDLAISFYRFSLFLEKIGKIEVSKRRLETAYRIFKEIDSRVFLKKTSELLGINEEDTTVQERFMDKERLSSIINVSQDISSILNIEELLEHILAKSIQVTGASRGFLFIYNEDKGALELKVTNDILDIKKDRFSSSIVDKTFKNASSIIIMDAQNDDELINNQSIIEYGLKSILCVPIKHHERTIGVCYLDNPLSSGVFTEEDAEMLEVFMNQAAIAIENAYLYNNLERKVEERTKELKETYEKLNDAYTHIKKDLGLAKEIQENILPRNINEINNLKFYIKYIPLIEVGGDIYDIYKMENGVLRIFLADAVGHGVVASLITMLIKSEYEKIKTPDKDPAKIFNILNNDIFCNLYRTLRITFTGIIVDLDVSRKKLTYSSAGNPAQYLIRDKKFIKIKHTNPIIGMYDEIEAKVTELELKDNDKIILFTDGLYEQFNMDFKTFGVERVKKIIEDRVDCSINLIIEMLINEMRSFIGNEALRDDITIIGIE